MDAEGGEIDATPTKMKLWRLGRQRRHAARPLDRLQVRHDELALGCSRHAVRARRHKPVLSPGHTVWAQYEIKHPCPPEERKV
eukprot:5453825-Prymnesium_polylepis.2